MPKVSVNIPVYNDEKYVRQTVESALAQTYKDLEVVIVDDGSTDRTAEIIKSFNDSRIKYVHQSNEGIGAARNRALAESSGGYIAFLDHDDLWLPNKLEKQMSLFERDPELGLVFCDTTFFNESGDMYSIYAEKKPPRGMVFQELLSWYFLSCETVVVKRSALDEVGFFPPKMMMAEEYDLFLRIAYRYPIDYIDEPLAKYRIHQKNYSWGKEMQALAEEREVIDHLLTLFPSIAVQYRTELAAKFNDLALRKALLLWKEGRKKEALLALLPVKMRVVKKAALLAAIAILRHKLISAYLKNPFHRL